MRLGHSIDDSRAKYPELTDEVLEDLRKWAKENGIMDIPLEQLALFTHSCYFDREAAIRCMSVYYRMRANVPEFFSNRDPKMEYLQQSLRTLYVKNL